MKRLCIILTALLLCASLLFAVDVSASFNVNWNLTYPAMASLSLLNPENTSESIPVVEGNRSVDIEFPDNSTQVQVAVVRFTTNVLGNYYMRITATPFFQNEQKFGYTLKVNNSQILVSANTESSSGTYNFSISAMNKPNQGRSQDYNLGIIMTSLDQIEIGSMSAVVTIEVGPR